MGRWTTKGRDDYYLATMLGKSTWKEGKKLVNTPATASTPFQFIYRTVYKPYTHTHTLNREDKARAMIIVAMTIMMIH